MRPVRFRNRDGRGWTRHDWLCLMCVSLLALVLGLGRRSSRVHLGHGREAVDRNVRPGLGRELGACPVRVPGLQFEPGKL